MLFKRFMSIFAMLVLALGTTICFSSCESNEDDSSRRFVGCWASTESLANIVSKPTVFDKYQSMGIAYDFVDESTVIKYDIASFQNSSYPNKFEKHSGWWYSSKRYYTYIADGNKAFLSNGDILTYWGNYLTKDGESGEYKKW